MFRVTVVIWFVGVLLASHCAGENEREPSLEALARMSDAELKKFDIAYLNLRCAEGLPGAKGLAPRGCLAKLDRWATWVSNETEKNLYRFHRSPKQYRNSEAYFRMALLVTVVAQDFRCRYKPERVADAGNPEPAEQFYADSKDVFIHGFLGKEATGTCASFPVLFAALGRRLGYPVKLVSTRSHLFCRWDDERGEKLNVEGTHGGMKSHPDAYYRAWPHKITDTFIKANGHLRSQNPKAELAGFLSTRASCLLAHKKYKEAEKAAALALRLMPRYPTTNDISITSKRWARKRPPTKNENDSHLPSASDGSADRHQPERVCLPRP